MHPLTKAIPYSYHFPHQEKNLTAPFELSQEEKQHLDKLLRKILTIKDNFDTSYGQIVPIDLIHHLQSTLHATVEIVGGLVRYILLFSRNQKETESPSDYDIRFHLPDYVSLDTCRNAVDCYLRSFNMIGSKVYSKQYKGNTHSIIAFGDREQHNLELIFTHGLNRDHLFTLDNFSICYQGGFHLQRGSEQSLQDLLTRTLRITNPEEVDHMGFPIAISYITRGYTPADLDSLSILQKTTFEHSENLFQFLKRCNANHHKKDPFAEIALVINACHLIKDTRLLELFYRAMIEIDHPIKFWFNFCKNNQLPFLEASYLLESLLLLYRPTGCELKEKQIVWKIEKSTILFPYRPLEAFRWLEKCNYFFPPELYKKFLNTQSLPINESDFNDLYSIADQLSVKDYFKKQLGIRLKDLTPTRVKIEFKLFQQKTIKKPNDLVRSLKEWIAFNPLNIQEKVEKLLLEFEENGSLSTIYHVINDQEIKSRINHLKIKRKLLLKAASNRTKFKSLVIDLSCDLILDSSHLAIISLINSFHPGEKLPQKVKKCLELSVDQIVLDDEWKIQLFFFMSTHKITFTFEEKKLKQMITSLKKDALLLLSQVLLGYQDTIQDKELITLLATRLLAFNCRLSAIKWCDELFKIKADQKILLNLFNLAKQEHPSLAAKLVHHNLSCVQEIFQESFDDEITALINKKPPPILAIRLIKHLKKPNPALTTMWLKEILASGDKQVIEAVDNFVYQFNNREMITSLCLNLIQALTQIKSEKIENYLNNNHPLFHLEFEESEICEISTLLLLGWLNLSKDELLEKIYLFRTQQGLQLPFKDSKLIDSKLFSAIAKYQKEPLWSLGLETFKSTINDSSKRGKSFQKVALDFLKYQPDTIDKPTTFLLFLDSIKETIVGIKASDINLKPLITLIREKKEPYWSLALINFILIIKESQQRAIHFKSLILEFLQHQPDDLKNPELIFNLMNAFSLKDFFTLDEALIAAKSLYKQDYWKKSYFVVLEQLQYKKKQLPLGLIDFYTKSLIPKLIENNIKDELSIIFTIILTHGYSGSDLIPIWVESILKNTFQNTDNFSYYLKYFSEAHCLFFHKNSPKDHCLDVMFKYILKGFTKMNSFPFFMKSLTYFFQQSLLELGEKVTLRYPPQSDHELLGLGCPGNNAKELSIGKKRFIECMEHFISFVLKEKIDDLPQRAILLNTMQYNIEQIILDFPSRKIEHIRLLSSFTFSPLAQHPKLFSNHLNQCFVLFHRIDYRQLDKKTCLMLAKIFLFIKSEPKYFNFTPPNFLKSISDNIKEYLNLDNTLTLLHTGRIVCDLQNIIHQNDCFLVGLIKEVTDYLKFDFITSVPTKQIDETQHLLLKRCQDKEKHTGILLFSLSILLLLLDKETNFQIVKEEIINLLVETKKLLDDYPTSNVEKRLELTHTVLIACYKSLIAIKKNSLFEENHEGFLNFLKQVFSLSQVEMLLQKNDEPYTTYLWEFIECVKDPQLKASLCKQLITSIATLNVQKAKDLLNKALKNDFFNGQQEEFTLTLEAIKTINHLAK